MNKTVGLMCTQEKKQIIGNFTKLVISIFFLLLLVLFPIAKVSAAGLSIKYDGKTIDYTSTQAKVTLDGKSVSLGGTPGIIIDGTCLVSYKEVFQIGLKASCQYDSKNGTITIRQYDTTIHMTLDSKTAYVNGLKKTLEVAPKKVTFNAKKVTKIYVPSRFVAETLGYSYTWNTSKKTAQIVSPFIIRYDKDWIVYKGTKGKVTFNNKSVNQTDMPSIVLDGTTLLRASKVIKDTLGAEYKYDSGTKKITISKDDVLIEMKVNSNQALVNGKAKTMGTKARLVTNKATNKSYIMVPGSFTVKELGYSYTWNSATKTSVIEKKSTTYCSYDWSSSLTEDNIVTSVSAKYNDYKDSIVIKGKENFQYTVSQSDTKKTLYIDIPNIYQNFEEISHSISDGYFINSLTISKKGTGIRLTVKKTSKASYYTSCSGNTLSVIICENNSSNQSISGYQLKIPVPDTVDFSAITDQDQYYNKKFIITIKGNYKSYFDTHPITYDSAIVSKVAVSVTSSNNTKVTVTTKRLYGYKYLDCGSYIGVKIANPSKIYKNIVVLDAGHGGKDSGAVNSKKAAYEKNLNLEIIYDKAKTYFNAKDSEIKAYWTRTDDTFVELSKRAEFAKSVEADLFISLHMNSAGSTAKGLEVLYASNNKNTMSGLNSKKMAEIFKQQLIEDLNMTDRGVKDRTRLIVLYKNSVPSVLIELGFISNSSDVAKLVDDTFQEKAAKAIYDAALTCFQKYPTGR
ncbi:N-acetylmuramoyl-L-alanine amidase [Velocimicrobium porci]|uniref:MurNAc-LAA domain-containing protein n=1 Tax=Velocimicrobium porci TaxID=2606634 RepID=A0A6L5XZR8_9FIRM|nr:N-acetylmuramoyl-L-alanine amidase [Velocimicrobium porci]MSS64360.1 hypothetical protein [Velocimicrobium porci]